MALSATVATGRGTVPFDPLANPASGVCLGDLATTVTTGIGTDETPTFAVFVTGNGQVPLDPASNWVFVRFRDGGGVTRGSTSVAARTQ